MKYLKLYEQLEEFTFAQWFGQFSISEIKGYIEIDCSYSNLTSLDGIENFINLTHISCNKNSLTSLKGIENLTKLTFLRCWANNLISMEAIKNLTKIKTLFCSDNEIANLKYIEDLENLMDLEICGCKLVNLEGIEKLTKLERLLCQENSLKNVDGIEKLEFLNIFSCHSNPLEEPFPLRLMKKIGINDTNMYRIYNQEDIERMSSYEFQKHFLEESPEKIMDLIPIGFNITIKKEYKDLIEFFGIK